MRRSVGAEITRTSGRQAARTDLLESQQKLRAVLEAIPDLVFSIGREGKVGYGKQMRSEDLLLDAVRGEGRCIQDLLPTPLAARVLEVVRATLATGDVQTLRYPLIVASGRKEFEARFAAQGADEVIVLVRNVTEEVQTRRLLEDERARLRALAERQVVAEEALRRRVVEAVHDGVAQELTMARLLLAKALGEPERQREGVTLAMAVIDGAIAGIEQLAAEVSPPTLRQLGLSSALREAGNRLQERHAIVFDYRQRGRSERLSPAREALLYWSSRELMLNVVKHAHASRISVVLDTLGEPSRAVVRLSVRDDGRGIESGRAEREGSGLVNTRERLRLAGGELRVQRLPRGTRATIRLPAEQPVPDGPG